MEPSSIVVHLLDCVTLQEELLNDVVSSIAHTIIYHRALGTVSVNFSTCSKLANMTFMHCGDEGIDDQVKELIRSIEKEIKESVSNTNKSIKGSFTIAFKAEERSKFPSFTDKKKAGKVFEKWEVPLEIINKRDSSANVSNNITELQVENTILKVVGLANQSYDHIDESYLSPQSGASIVTFPFQVRSSFGLGNEISKEGKKLINLYQNEITYDYLLVYVCKSNWFNFANICESFSILFWWNTNYNHLQQNSPTFKQFLYNSIKKARIFIFLLFNSFSFLTENFGRFDRYYVGLKDNYSEFL